MIGHFAHLPTYTFVVLVIWYANFFLGFKINPSALKSFVFNKCLFKTIIPYYTTI